MNFTLLITVLVTALTLVVAAYVSRMRVVSPHEAAHGCLSLWDSTSLPSCSSCLM